MVGHASDAQCCDVHTLHGRDCSSILRDLLWMIIMSFAIKIEEWRQHWSPNYVSIIWSGVSSSGAVSTSSSTGTSVGSDTGASPSTPGTSARVSP